MQQGGFFYVETKGIWNVADRQKHLLIKRQHPDLDIRFVFSNCNSKLYKGSKTTYADYCDKHGFVYSHKTIPEEWLHEGTYYQVNASGQDQVPQSLQEKYRNYILGIDWQTRTQDAHDKGIFGAPTFVVNNKIFWGQDRLEFALEEYNK